MIRRLLALSPANLLHEIGTGRALDNACRDCDDLAATIAAVDALAARVEAPIAAAPAPAAARAAA